MHLIRLELKLSQSTCVDLHWPGFLYIWYAAWNVLDLETAVLGNEWQYLWYLVENWNLLLCYCFWNERRSIAGLDSEWQRRRRNSTEKNRSSGIGYTNHYLAIENNQRTLKWIFRTNRIRRSFVPVVELFDHVEYPLISHDGEHIYWYLDSLYLKQGIMSL